MCSSRAVIFPLNQPLGLSLLPLNLSSSLLPSAYCFRLLLVFLPFSSAHHPFLHSVTLSSYLLSSCLISHFNSPFLLALLRFAVAVLASLAPLSRISTLLVVAAGSAPVRQLSIIGVFCQIFIFSLRKATGLVAFNQSHRSNEKLSFPSSGFLKSGFFAPIGEIAFKSSDRTHIYSADHCNRTEIASCATFQ